MRYEEVDRHAFGVRANITKPLRKEKVHRITVRAIPEEENENVKRLRERYFKMKEMQHIKNKKNCFRKQ